MDFSSFLDCFSEDVVSIDDYLDRVQNIERFIQRKRKCKKWNIFYRGDRYFTPVQSNLFRRNQLADEADNFQKWQLSCKDSKSGSFECLAKMQHHINGTRLLDFTEDPLVALRFACGEEGDNCPKKITVYCTDFVEMDTTEWENIKKAFMKLVTANETLSNVCFDKKEKELLCRDYFVRAIPAFERIKRQKGLFLLMGNQKFSNNKREIKFCETHKIKHELSPTAGRGKFEPGFVGVLKINPLNIEKIRNDLESSCHYRMKYLMNEE